MQSGVIDDHQLIGRISQQLLHNPAGVIHDRTDLPQYWKPSHHCAIGAIRSQYGAGCSEVLTTDPIDFQRRIQFEALLHQPGGMEISGGFACADQQSSHFSPSPASAVGSIR